MKKLTYFLILVIALLQYNTIFADTYQEGLELYKQKKFQEAIEKFEESLKDGSADNEEVHLYLGNCYLKIGEDNNAIREYGIAEEFKKNREPIYSNLAALYFGNNDLQKALYYCKKLITENPNNPMHNWLMANIYMSMNEPKEAKKYFYKSIELSNDIYISYNGLGYAFIVEGNFEEAYKNFKKAIEIREDFIEGYKNIIFLIPEEIIPKEEYKEILTKYLLLNPTDTQAKQKLERLTTIEEDKEQ